MLTVLSSLTETGRWFALRILDILDRSMISPTRNYLDSLVHALVGGIMYPAVCFCMVSLVALKQRHAQYIKSRTAIRNRLSLGVTTATVSEYMLVGMAIGDSFGAGVEFEDFATIQAQVDGTRYVNLRGSYLFGRIGRNYLKGNYTDDTEMTIGLCKFLMQYRPWTKTHMDEDDQTHLIECWLNEYRHVNTWIGLAWRTFAGIGRAGHGAFEDFALGKKSLEEMRLLNHEKHRRYPGNAPVMRCLPLALLPTKDDDENVLVRLSSLNANCTHPHVKARSASLILVLAARMFITDPTVSGKKESVFINALERYIQICKEHPDHFDQETFEYLQMVDSLEDYQHDVGLKHVSTRTLIFPREQLCGKHSQPIVWASEAKGRTVRGLDSDAMRTVGCVLYLVKFHRTHRESLLTALYIGGDVDSIAAILMALLCARYGVSFNSPDEQVADNSLPDFFVYELEGLEYILKIAQEFHNRVVSTSS